MGQIGGERKGGWDREIINDRDLEVMLACLLQVVDGAGVGLVQTLLPSLVLQLQLLQLLAQVLSLLIKLGL